MFSDINIVISGLFDIYKKLMEHSVPSLQSYVSPEMTDANMLLCNIPLLCDFNQKYGLILTHSSIFVWRILWIEEPGKIQSIGSQSQTQVKLLSTHAWVNFTNPSLHFVI